MRSRQLTESNAESVAKNTIDAMSSVRSEAVVDIHPPCSRPTVPELQRELNRNHIQYSFPEVCPKNTILSEGFDLKYSTVVQLKRRAPGRWKSVLSAVHFPARIHKFQDQN